jgi:hypothetical protein
MRARSALSPGGRTARASSRTLVRLSSALFSMNPVYAIAALARSSGDARARAALTARMKVSRASVRSPARCWAWARAIRSS